MMLQFPENLKYADIKKTRETAMIMTYDGGQHKLVKMFMCSFWEQ